MSDIRAHIVIGAIEPMTEGGRLWHQEWHDGEAYPGAPTKCGDAGCGFLGRILSIENEAVAEYLASPEFEKRLAKALQYNLGSSYIDVDFYLGYVAAQRGEITEEAQATALEIAEALRKTER